VSVGERDVKVSDGFRMSGVALVVVMLYGFLVGVALL